MIFFFKYMATFAPPRVDLSHDSVPRSGFRQGVQAVPHVALHEVEASQGFDVGVRPLVNFFQLTKKKGSCDNNDINSILRQPSL